MKNKQNISRKPLADRLKKNLQEGIDFARGDNKPQITLLNQDKIKGMIYSRLSDLPPLIRTFLYVHDGFLVGSYASYVCGEFDDTPSDIDIIIPLSKWSLAMKSIPKGSTTNTFGGVKIKIESPNLTCDIWSQDISDYLNNLTTAHPILHPKTNTTLVVNRASK